MSLINRIELSNFLDKTGGSNWNPTYRHNVLDLKGQNTAIVLMNGSGKTTITTAILGLLSRQQFLVSTMRNVFSPSSFGVYTHVRIEFVQPDLRSALPTLPTIETSVTGEKYVFGVCGHKGEKKSLKYYCYPGTLEDAPVACHEDGATELLLNEEFEKAIRAKNDARYGKSLSKDEWLDRVHDHWGAQQLNQMVSFLRDGGGDKSASLYKTKVSKGEKFHESFFYTHIAPQLTIGEATSESEKGEVFLDDTIVNSSLNIVEAQLEGERKEKRLQRQKKASAVFTDIKHFKNEIVAAERNFRKASLKVTKVAAMVKYLVIDVPLPGFPVFVRQENNTLNNLIKNIVIVPDAEDPFVFKDVGIADLLGKEIHEINRMCSDKNIKPSLGTHYIEMTLPGAISNSGGGLHVTLYSLKNVLKIIDCMDVKALRIGGGGADREVLKEMIRSALDVFRKQCDTSILRGKVELFFTEIQKTENTKQKITLELKRLDDEKVALEERLKTFKVDKIAFEEMRDSELFTEVELNDPQKAKDTLKEDAEILEQNKRNVENTLRSSHGQYELYQSFSKEYPLETPDDHLLIIEKEEKRLAELFQTTKEHRDNAQRELGIREGELNKLDAELRVVHREFGTIQKVYSGFLAYKEAFPDEDISGFEKRIKTRGVFLDLEIRKRTSALEQSAKDYESELQFYEHEGNVDPSEWLMGIDEERAVLISKTKSIKCEIEQFEAELDLLQQNKVAPGPNALKILEYIPPEITYQSLYTFIKNNTVSPTQAELFLSLFSSLLFAPVIKNKNDISRVLDIFTEKEEDILLPVFHEDSFKDFLQQNPEITVADDDVFYLVAGKKTELIECILDPEKREKRKGFVESQLVKKKEEQDNFKNRILEISSNSKIVSLAQKAKDSKSRQLVEEVDRLTGEIEDLKEEQKRHQERFTAVVMEAVNAAESFVSLGGQDRYTELRDKQVLLQKTFDTLKIDITNVRDRFITLNKDSEKNGQKLADYKVETNERKLRLKALRDFLPDGLGNYNAAMTLIADCEEQLLKIRRKQEYDLNRAASYVAALAISNKTDLLEQFNRIGLRRESAVKGIADQDKNLAKLRKELRKYQKHSEEYDRFLSDVMVLCDRCLQDMCSDLENDTADLGSIVEPASKLRSYLLQEEQTDFVSIHVKSQEIMTLLKKDDFEVLNTKVASAQRRVRECQKEFNERCDREITLSGKDSILTLEEKNLLKEVKETPEKIFHWADLFAETLHREAEDFSKAKEHEEKLRNTLAGSLTSLTDKAIGNYRTLRRILSETADSASYFIVTEVATRESIESAIDDMIEMVKSAHTRYLGDKEDRYREFSKTDDDVYRKNLKERISDKCYRSIFLKPVISYKHPDIRGGNLTTFNISEKFKGISEGEKTSLALLMQVIMARYAQKRKIAEEFGQGIRRRRDAAESPNVLIIDGLFSSLSKPSLIRQAFKSIINTQGAFQIIGLIHNPTYVGSHDFNVFPNLFVGRVYTDTNNSNDNEGWVAFEHRQKEIVGQMGFADFRASKS